MEPHPVIIRTGCQHKITHTFAVQLGFIQAVTGNVQPGSFHTGHHESFPQNAGRLPLGLLVGKLRVDPAGFPAAVDQTHLKAGCFHFPVRIVLIPELNAPIDFFSGLCRRPAIGYSHLRGGDLSTVPNDGIPGFGDDLIGSLGDASVTDPTEGRIDGLQANGIHHMFCFQFCRFHSAASLM